MGNGSHLVKFLTLIPQGHSSFITHLDWSKDGNFIMSNSGDYEILYCEWPGDGDHLIFFFFFFFASGWLRILYVAHAVFAFVILLIMSPKRLCGCRQEVSSQEG